jgi:hypothetical protein
MKECTMAQRTLGSLTSADLGKTIILDGESITLMVMIHTIDENKGLEYTVIYDNVSMLFPSTELSDVVITMEEEDDELVEAT